MKRLLAVAVVLLACLHQQVQGHGMMLDPPGRSSRWRYNASAPKNYDDNGLNCGGYGVQWGTHKGKCGLCGDNYGTVPPRPNELGGKYGGVGVITKSYNTATAVVGVTITANHLGYIYFNLCNLDEFGTETEECYQKYRLNFIDGTDSFYVGTTTGKIATTVVFPAGLSCKHCVLRWTYRAGNNWGYCDDGSGKLGCGSQEHFLSCADISIQAASSRLLFLLYVASEESLETTELLEAADEYIQFDEEK